MSEDEWVSIKARRKKKRQTKTHSSKPDIGVRKPKYGPPHPFLVFLVRFLTIVTYPVLRPLMRFEAKVNSNIDKQFKKEHPWSSQPNSSGK